ncbi:GlcG/HbpS family heme-binding protein [Mameliella sediminis]|uniref:GlcG/HbpS family heme-binding protein n=1 Tax=Mameliella sediminis TaxID=2836866 RepID=UPI001C44AABD|nr:heme-binding protein [Mameliella sediminis]MBV7395869.1 heme-binding protein [Mameliella sediminis]MBY6144755.1 heme-binding protein [Mameliella alba]MCA0956859.1 heme-binding protein [Mameliella alba]
MHQTTLRTVIETARNAAAQEGFAINIAVVDSAAHLAGFERMDGAVLGAIDVAQKKARTAALFQTDSLTLGAGARPDGAIYTLENTNGGMISFGGGVVLYDAEGRFIGAVGVAGATVEADETIAQAAAAALR